MEVIVSGIRAGFKIVNRRSYFTWCVSHGTFCFEWQQKMHKTYGDKFQAFIPSKESCSAVPGTYEVAERDAEFVLMQERSGKGNFTG